MAREEIELAMKNLGLTVEDVFIPWSRSRNKDQKDPSLNWRVTLIGPMGKIIETDFSAGLGHCTYVKSVLKGNTYRLTVNDRKAIEDECETGIGRPIRAYPSKRVHPDPCDVVASLVIDASAIDEGSFEDWASNYGYDTDSRKAEAMYRQCVETGLRLRNALGEEGLRRLREALEDY